MLFDAMISSDFVHAKMKQTPICQIMEGAFSGAVVKVESYFFINNINNPGILPQLALL